MQKTLDKTPHEVLRLAARLCREENAKWPDEDQCLLPPGSCPWCQQRAARQAKEPSTMANEKDRQP